MTSFRSLSHSRQRGFSLIELMVAIAIGLFMVALLAVLFSNTSGNRSELDRVTRLMENARFSADILADDISHAGYYGSVAPLPATTYLSPAPCANVAATILADSFDSATSKLPAPLQGWDDAAASGIVALDCLGANRIAGQDVLTVRRASSQTLANAAAVQATEIYLQPTQCALDPLVPFFVASNDPGDFTLRTYACTAGTVAPIRRYFTRTYYLDTCNQCGGAGDGIPTLKRMEVRNGTYDIVSLAEGVIKLQIEYGFDTNGDGATDVYRTTPNPAGGADSLWENVVTVRVHLLVRTTEPTQGLVAAHTYNVGSGHAAESCDGGYRCRLVSTTFRVRNIAGRRDT